MQLIHYAFTRYITPTIHVCMCACVCVCVCVCVFNFNDKYNISYHLFNTYINQFCALWTAFPSPSDVDSSTICVYKIENITGISRHKSIRMNLLIKYWYATISHNICVHIIIAICLLSFWCLTPICFISRKRMRWFQLSLIAKRCQGRLIISLFSNMTL